MRRIVQGLNEIIIWGTDECVNYLRIFDNKVYDSKENVYSFIFLLNYIKECESIFYNSQKVIS